MQSSGQLEKNAANSDGNDAITQASYQLYFDSGLYDKRYPSPNQTMWRWIETFVSPSKAVLDFGCGSGRYLLRLRGRVARAIGFDVSHAALKAMHERGRDWSELSVIGPDADLLDAHIQSQGSVDLVLCLFGVLGHITERDARAEALLRMRRALKPSTGRLLISVPNQARRFRSEQAQNGGDNKVCYQRQTDDGGVVVLNYQLFDPEMLISELAQAGFNLHRIGCESILPESWLLHNPVLRWFDGLIAPLCPARWGYGIYAVASC
ncbi:MAG: class I SAM-dependent methyltransferase [Roseobacter sp.]